MILRAKRRDTSSKQVRARTALAVLVSFFQKTVKDSVNVASQELYKNLQNLRVSVGNVGNHPIFVVLRTINVANLFTHIKRC